MRVLSRTRLYLSRQSSSLGRCIPEQVLFALVGWVPRMLGIRLRAALYKLIMKVHGFAAIGKGVRLRFASNVRLGKGGSEGAGSSV